MEPVSPCMLVDASFACSLMGRTVRLTGLIAVLPTSHCSSTHDTLFGKGQSSFFFPFYPPRDYDVWELRLTSWQYMKNDRGRNPSKRAEDAKQGDELQSNKRQLSSRGTADRPPSKRRKSTSREPNDDDDSSSVEDSESESESETDSEAGDIPYENGSPERLVCCSPLPFSFSFSFSFFLSFFFFFFVAV